MRTELAIILVLLILIPLISAGTTRDTFIFLDETAGGDDLPGSLSFFPAQYESEQAVGHVVLRMGSKVRDFDGQTTLETWSWRSGTVSAQTCCANSIDAIDYQGDGLMNDVVYISRPKKISIRTADEESSTDTLWEREFTENVYSVVATDFDGDGRKDDIIVAAGQRIYAIQPSINNTFIDYLTKGITPYIITPADIDEDGKMNDVIVGTWVGGGSTGSDLSGGRVQAYFEDGNPGWSFPATPLEKRVTYLKAYDRDADGSDDDIIVVFTDDASDPNNPDFDLYVTSSGSQAFFKSNVLDASPADFDMDGVLDDLLLVTTNTLFAYANDFNFIDSVSKNDFNTSVDKKHPTELLSVSSLSMQKDSKKGNLYNDVALLSVISRSTDNQQRTIFFIQDFAEEEPPTTTTTTTTSTTTTTLIPQRPTARITGIPDGATVQEGSTFELDGSRSEDSDGQIVSYQWLLDGSLKKSGGQATTYTLTTTGLSPGAHVLALVVIDDDGMDSREEVTFSISKGNVPPIADAGQDMTVEEGRLVALSASGSNDPDGGIESYEWSEDGTVFSIDESLETTFPPGSHTITLKVTDGMGASSTDTLKITVVEKNLLPKADAGEDITVSEGETVHLSGEGSLDPDGNITAYLWILPDGKSVNKPSFDAKFPVGTHTLTLNVTDNRGAIASDSVIINVKEPPGFIEQYGAQLKVVLLTLLSMASATLIYLRTSRKGLY